MPAQPVCPNRHRARSTRCFAVKCIRHLTCNYIRTTQRQMRSAASSEQQLRRVTMLRALLRSRCPRPSCTQPAAAIVCSWSSSRCVTAGLHTRRLCALATGKTVSVTRLLFPGVVVFLAFTCCVHIASVTRTLLNCHQGDILRRVNNFSHRVRNLRRVIHRDAG